MDTPAYIPPVLQPKRPELRAKCVWGQEGYVNYALVYSPSGLLMIWYDRTYGFMKYVQLHEEDFDA